MDFAIEWRERRIGPMRERRVFLDYVIDGEPLSEQIDVGNKIFPYHGLWTAEEETETTRRLRGEEEPDVGDRVALYVCAWCGDVMCGAITAAIERVGDEIVWRDLANSSYDYDRDGWHHDSTGFESWSELRFQATDYYKAIANRPPRGRKRSGRRLRTLGRSSRLRGQARDTG